METIWIHTMQSVTGTISHICFCYKVGICRRSKLVLTLILMPQSCTWVCSPPGALPPNLPPQQPRHFALGSAVTVRAPGVLCTHRTGIRLKEPYARDWLSPEEQQVLEWALITNLSALLSASSQCLCTPKDADLRLRCWCLSCGCMPSALHFTQYAPEKK